MINIMFLSFRKFSTYFNNLFNIFLFLCCIEIECATRCRKRRLYLNWKMKTFFSFVYFKSCEFFSWRIVKLCLSNVVDALLFTYWKVFLTFQQRIECALKLLILKFCLIYSATQLICTMIILYKFFFKFS